MPTNGKSGPYAEALYYHIAKESLEAARNESDKFTRYQRIATTIVFAALCLEAFINQQFAEYVEARGIPEKKSERIEFETKWLILPLLLGAKETFKEDAEPFQTFHKLVKTRNNHLVHFKPTQERKSGQWYDHVTDLQSAEKYVENIPAMIEELNNLTGIRVPDFLQGDKYLFHVWSAMTTQWESLARTKR